MRERTNTKCFVLFSCWTAATTVVAPCKEQLQAAAKDTSLSRARQTALWVRRHAVRVARSLLEEGHTLPLGLAEVGPALSAISSGGGSSAPMRIASIGHLPMHPLLLLCACTRAAMRKSVDISLAEVCLRLFLRFVRVRLIVRVRISSRLPPVQEVTRMDNAGTA
jgi:hypothetical protein